MFRMFRFSFPFLGTRPKKKPPISVNFDALRLIRPDFRYLSSFRESYKEYRQHAVEDFGYHKVDTLKEFARFVEFSSRLSLGINLPEGAVQTSMFWLCDDENYLGSGSVRHYLNDKLRNFGGHIGYSIRPQAWGLGLGTIQLRLLLIEAKKLGITRARLTCYEHNTASRRVMEKNGAYYVDRVINRISGKDRPTLIFEIDLTDLQ